MSFTTKATMIERMWAIGAMVVGAPFAIPCYFAGWLGGVVWGGLRSGWDSGFDHWL